MHQRNRPESASQQRNVILTENNNNNNKSQDLGHLTGWKLFLVSFIRKRVAEGPDANPGLGGFGSDRGTQTAGLEHIHGRSNPFSSLIDFTVCSRWTQMYCLFFNFNTCPVVLQ